MRRKNNYFYALGLLLAVILLQLISFCLQFSKMALINDHLLLGYWESDVWTIVIPLVALILFCSIIFIKKTLNIWALLVLIGAISNILDRIFYHGTIDYINFFNFFRINFADIFLVIGLAGLIYVYISKQQSTDHLSNKT